MSIASELKRIINGKNDIKQFVYDEFGMVIPSSVTLDKYKYYIENNEDYLSFYCDEDGTIGWKCTRSNGQKTIQYSKDFGATWTDLTSTTDGATVTVAAGDIVWFKGSNTTYADDAKKKSYNNSFTLSNKAHVYGNVNSLTGDNSIVSKLCFSSLFKNCVNLYTYDSKQIILPATTLASKCYSYMFDGCTSLTTAPELPVTTLASNCYQYMFYNCTSLTTAPELPATTLADYCYNGMFSYCTSLTAAPKLPVTTLASNCYSNMFSGCISLTAAPKLPATTLASSCYASMFSHCTFTAAPELPATTLASYCYNSMFYGCTSLTSAPELPATTLATSCYVEMFRGCTSLTSAPELPATTLATSCYVNMFMGCTSLTSAPELPATTLEANCYQNMFDGCTSLTTAPELPATTFAYNCYSYMFNDCTSLNYIKALFTTPPSDTYTRNWVSGVAPTGTFVKSADATWDVVGADGVPTGWTVVREPVFSVSSTKKVKFAKGNLQAVIGTGISDYRATASEWNFAEHQYDFIGENTSFAVGTTVDLFGWVGASASYDSYGLCTNTSTNNAYYGTSASDALKTDWGSIPGVVSSCGSGWRTLTYDEWNYLFTQRTNASSLYGQCQITTTSGTVTGLLILPDNWVKPSNCTVTPGAGAFNRVTYSATAASGASNAWVDMEAAGAVFLPSSGLRYGADAYYIGTKGHYWSSTVMSADDVRLIYWENSYFSTGGIQGRSRGFAVRLVKDAN